MSEGRESERKKTPSKMLRTIFEAECALSPAEGILGKEPPLEVLKTSVLNHIPTGWSLSLPFSLSLPPCLRLSHSPSLCACVCARASVRDLTVNRILCDFVWPPDLTVAVD